MLGYPPEVARVLGSLCTNRAPHAVLTETPPGITPHDIQARHRQKQRLRLSHLPQGAPTSPALANLVAFRMDLRLQALASRLGATYSRYADDLAFSGGDELRRRTSRFQSFVYGVVTDEGFTLNFRKTRIMNASQRQELAGVLVNLRPNVRRKDFDALKAVLNNCVCHGPALQNRAQHPRFREHLEGRVGWVEQLNPLRGAKLRALFEQIAW